MHGCCNDTCVGQVERVWSREVPVQQAAERHREAKAKSENRGNQVGADGEGHPGQGVKRTGLHQDRRAHWIERRLLHDTAAQDCWDYNVFDAQSTYLQSDGIERLLLLRIPHKNQPPGTKRRQVFVATGSIDGTPDAGRTWYDQSKKVLEAAGFLSLSGNKAFSICLDLMDQRLSRTRMSMIS